MRRSLILLLSILPRLAKNNAPTALLATCAVLACSVLACATSAQAEISLNLTAASGGNSNVTQISAGSAVTLIAAATAGSASVTTGQVTFCDQAVALCGYSSSIAVAQLTPAGTASVTLVPTPGSHTYRATFAATTANPSFASATLALTVTGALATTTTLKASNSAPYTFTATVNGIGALTNALTGGVTFTDTTTSAALGEINLGTPTSSFSLNAGASYTLPPAVDYTLTGDFNGDGKLDLALAVTRFFPDNGTEDGVAIMLGGGDGTFAAPVVYDLPDDAFAVYMVTGDFNGDGKLDIATANNDLNSVSILFGNGDGTFTVAAPISVGTAPQALAVGDFNRDGIADLVVTYNSTDNPLILLGNGNGTFTKKVNALPIYATTVAVADFNADGIADLAVVDGTATATVLFGSGDGSFRQGPSATVVDGTVSVAVGDFNSDGKPDLATLNLGSDTQQASSLTILLGAGDGTFTHGTVPFIDISTNNGVGGLLATADLNGDGKSDVVVVDYSYINEFISNGDGTFSRLTLPGATSGPDWFTVAAGDFNGDGLADIATQNTDTVLANIYLNQLSQQATAVLNNINILGSGQHTVQASYAGDTAFAASSASVQLNAVNIATALSLTATPTTVAPGAQVQLTATLSPYFSANLTTNGEPITLIVNGSNFGTAKLNSGVATFTVNNLATGVNTLSASYAGDSSFSASKSASVTVKVAPLAATPTFSPTPGTYTTIQTVTLADATSGATIYYTTNGTNPTTSSPKYTAPLTVGATTTIKAFAYASGHANSPTAAATYTINLPRAAAPVFSPVQGTYHAATTVTMTDATSGSTIHYTTDGTPPTAASPRYINPIRLVVTTTFRAIASAPGYTSSAITTGSYTIHVPPAVTTLSAINLLTTGATIRSSANDENQPGKAWFVYGTSQTQLNKQTAFTQLPASLSAQDVSVPITGLTTKTTYYYQAVVQNQGGTVSGSILTFTTK